MGDQEYVAVREENVLRALQSAKIRVGKAMVQGNLVNYIYVPHTLLDRSKVFDYDEVFAALEIDTPQLIFQTNKVPDVSEWNLKLPKSRQKLFDVAMSGEDPDGGPSQEPTVLHYRGVVRENAKRLLHGISSACIQSKAIYKLLSLWAPVVQHDEMAGWLSKDAVPLLGVVDCEELADDILESLMDRTVTVGSEDNDSTSPVVVDMEPWYNGSRKPVIQNGAVYKSVFHPQITHLIITDNKRALEDRVRESIPEGLIVLNGPGIPACVKFVESVHAGTPIFIFKSTGALADLVVEFLETAEIVRRRKKKNPSAKPIMPFNPDELKHGYKRNMYLEPFSDEMIEMAKLLNILIENFPDRYNPEAVMVIDMFGTTEDQMQDQLTKTMSTVFEGIIEMGGAGPEAKRLSYGWNLRYMMLYNYKIQRRRSNIIWALIVLFTLLSTVSPIVYLWCQLGSLPDECCELDDDLNDFHCGHGCSEVGREVLNTMNLVFPLIATVLRGIFAVLNPEDRCTALNKAATVVESEIYMYRTKVGKYSVVKKKSTQLDDKKGKDQKEESEDASPSSGNPSKAFSNALDAIWVDLAGSDVKRDTMYNTPAGFDPLEDIYKRLESNINEQKQFYDIMKTKISKKDDGNHQVQEESDDESTNIEEGVERESLTILEHARFLDPSIGVQTLGRGMETFASALPNPLVRKQNQIMEISKDAEAPVYAVLSSEGGTAKAGVEGSTDDEDGLSSMTADSYITLRLLPMLAEYSSKSPSISRDVSTVAITVVLLSVVASGLAAFEQSVWIPATLAVSAAVSSWANHQNKENKLGGINGAIHQMHQLLVWWNGLTMIEKRVIQNKEHLVLSTENIILGAKTALLTSTEKNEEEEET